MFQIQGDKEKLLYELDTMQAELEKCNHASSRLQKEKDDAYGDIDRSREKYDKLQVCTTVCCDPGNIASGWMMVSLEADPT